MKLTPKLKEKIDTYFDNISADDLYNKLKYEYSMSIDHVSNETYNNLIDLAYSNYSEEYEKDNSIGICLLVKRLDGKSTYRKPDKDTFIDLCKFDSSFSDKWGLNFEERFLEHSERKKLMDEYTDSRNMFRICYQITITGYDYDKYNEVCDSYNIPKKLIKLTYNNETVEIYE
jgi:hypothetical protein